MSEQLLYALSGQRHCAPYHANWRDIIGKHKHFPVLKAMMQELLGEPDLTDEAATGVIFIFCKGTYELRDERHKLGFTDLDFERHAACIDNLAGKPKEFRRKFKGLKGCELGDLIEAVHIPGQPVAHPLDMLHPANFTWRPSRTRPSPAKWAKVDINNDF